MHTRRVQKVSVCARSIRNMTETLSPATLMVTSGVREDIIVATAVAALNGVEFTHQYLRNRPHAGKPFNGDSHQ
ncbi:hypothetical protein LCGC14_0642330 [marine sediment metagenome]|uniref:DRTGG domain-containing protein n=2 Tax=root TaxID=1 RepID=A0A0F9U762_9ZZZZ